MKKLSKITVSLLVFITIFISGRLIVRASYHPEDRTDQAAGVVLSTPASTNPECNKPIMARVKFSSNPMSGFGVRNWGTGNLARQIYVGGNAVSNLVAAGEWFKIYDGHNYIIDPDSGNYEAVKGLAVQRLNGAVRIVLHGSLEEPADNPLANRERVQASLEFSNDGGFKRSADIVPYSQVSDTQNPIDFVPGHGTNEPQDDRLEIVNNLSQFKLVVNTNDDGFYTYYHNINPACK